MNKIITEKNKIQELIQSNIKQIKPFLYFNKNNNYLFVSNVLIISDNNFEILNNLIQNKLNFKVINNLLYINPPYNFINDVYNKKNSILTLEKNKKYSHIYRCIQGCVLNDNKDIELFNDIIKMKFINSEKYYKKIMLKIVDYKKRKVPISKFALDILICCQE